MSDTSDFPTDESVEGPDGNSPLAQFIGSPKDVVNRYTRCPICAANLHFTHMTDFSRNITQEYAKCPECGIQVRHVLHRLQ